MQKFPRFSVWLEARRSERGPLVQRVDQIAALIIAAGAAGITHSDLISAIDLDRRVVTNVLKALLDIGLITATGSGLSTVFRYCCKLPIVA